MCSSRHLCRLFVSAALSFSLAGSFTNADSAHHAHAVNRVLFARVNVADANGDADADADDGADADGRSECGDDAVRRR